ncbi:diaminopimelate dehydrogenase [Ignatzschineria cameli]|uniref:Meso-diaminopimelate D-dehydrogenase n=1 Tax=Ignatzschineria cameli TaxID=2182793 RepID=A0A2U2ARQ9_9GAMM|nr:diaminopimelate dehydrogenase [Ignatzschineria cameli]PWD86707.1 diaminopimelate dehydrogenase [Ignatzschineria cameli]PWD86940.1 diaminopimelate dehydrogenase [Ignatzschineria cameli]PWD91912.1 diaminopimelate dehydrogenase [Ignatzschineria cameli]PWD93501.1 diaminopimelate dehydrogenase [Ignatzschineria cameli]PWD94243.1 diaminopimelate dehydrogenase [Ignatzschineria cameli]
MTRKINAAIVGFGNIGRYVLNALEAAPDFSVAGIVRREKREIPGVSYPIVTDIDQLDAVDVAILCVPSRQTKLYATQYLKKGIHTVDSFDIHSDIAAVRNELNKIAKEHQRSAIISAGWDPGSDSIIRALLLAAAPKGVTYTNFGPGMSMGHSTAVKAIPGVRDALSVTIPIGTGQHRRMVYIEVEEGYDFATVQSTILNDDYFKHDDTIITEVEDVDQLKDAGHGVKITRKGVSGTTDNQIFEFDMRINNPALTAQILVATARAVTKQQPGAYTMIEIPMIDLLPGDRDELINALV